jgi:hypothetical protein
MFEPKAIVQNKCLALAPLDRLTIAYLILPLFIFLIGWLEWWMAAICVACSAYALRPLFMSWGTPFRAPLTTTQIAIAVGIGCLWTLLGGVDHLFYTNFDWHMRDAVLHDLVASRWPVGYGLRDGMDTLLRAPLGYYLPAALIGKLTTLPTAHLALLAWTAAGTALFLLQVVSLVDSTAQAAFTAIIIVIFFSGADIVGYLINYGDRFRRDWNITTHLEWWAGSYQYSSMTTQLFWVPNHAFGGWLMIGLLYRGALAGDLEPMLPILLVAAALWSPLTALGLVPFVLWRGVREIFIRRSSRLLHPKVWAPALLVGFAVCAYLTLAAGSVPKGSTLAASGDAIMSVLRQLQFFILEAGLLGWAIILIRPSAEITIALCFLAVLPAVYLGPGNDLVMRASIPGITVLAISAASNLLNEKAKLKKKAFLSGLLMVGAMTPIAEIARAVLYPAWPINLSTTLVGANCGGFPPHYVALLNHQWATHLLRPVHDVPLGIPDSKSCGDTAFARREN